ncbi:TylF/MycF/NovP-related O-methyltransferase [candidate division KSB1 bacterium]
MSKKESNELVFELENVEKGFIKQAKFAVKRYGFLGTFSRYLIYKIEVKKFITEPAGESEKQFRRDLVKKFSGIHSNVVCAHSPYQFIAMAKYLLEHEIEGPIVQCGCFKGGSTAKLSLLAEKTNRKLYVYDSFQGLPEPDSKDELDMKGFDTTLDYTFKAGDFKGELEEVKSNIRNFGCIDVCEFIPGFFNDSLPGFELNPAFVYIDVDFVSSARDCLKYIWPAIRPGGYWFTHEAGSLEYLYGMFDKDWWKENLNDVPPLLVGGGVGLSIITPSVAFFRKPPMNSAGK